MAESVEKEKVVQPTLKSLRGKIITVKDSIIEDFQLIKLKDKIEPHIATQILSELSELKGLVKFVHENTIEIETYAITSHYPAPVTLWMKIEILPDSSITLETDEAAIIYRKNLTVAKGKETKYLKTNTLSGTLQKKMQEICEAAEEVHPDRWDFAKIHAEEFRQDAGAVYRLIIAFPEVTIENSEGRSHPIRDLFIAWYFTKDLVPYSNWMGTRTTLTYAEWCSDYMHSHMEGGRRMKFTGLCLGAGQIIDTVTDCSIETWDPNRFVKALLLMYSFVAWESLGGGPYRKIQNIQENSNSPSGREPEHRDILNVFNECMLPSHKDSFLDILPVHYNTTNLPLFEVDASNLAFQQYLAHVVPAQLRKLRNENGELLNPVVSSSEKERTIRDINGQTVPKRDQVYFKGEWHKFGILDEEIELDAGTLVPHPRFMKMFKIEVESKINNYCLKNKKI